MNAYVEILLVFVFPTVVWSAGLIPKKYLEPALVLMGLLLLAIVAGERWSWQKLGVRLDNLGESFWPYVMATVLGIIAISIYGKFHRRRFVPAWVNHQHVLFWATIGSIVQEVIYRGVLMPKLLETTSLVAVVVIVNAFLFWWPHVIFPQIKENSLLIFVAGALFAAMYYYYPNLILVAAMHMVLNFTATSFGFFTFNPQANKV